MLVAQQGARPLVDFTLAPLWEDHGIALAIMGVLVVFTALVLLAAFIEFLPRILATVSQKEPAEPAPRLADEDELDTETLVVIAAAVAAVLGQPHRIIRVRGLTSEDRGWSLEGRMQHHHSHRVEHRERR